MAQKACTARRRSARRGTAASVICIAALALVGLSGVASAAEGTTSKPTKGGTFTWYNALIRANLDPTSVTGSQGIISDGPILRPIYGALFYVDSEDGYRIHMGMAQSMKSDDALVWTLKLKPSIKFTDSTPFDAAAVKAWWDWLANPASRSTSLSSFSNVQSMEVVDPTTLKVTLKSPDAVFDLSLAGTNAMMVPSPAARAKYGTSYGTSADTTVGAGAFIVKEFVRDSKLVMDRNPNYFEKGLPYLDHYVMNFVADAQTRYNAVLTGQGDATYDQVLDFKSSAARDGLGFKGIPPGGPVWLELNNAIAPFNDPRVRRAVNVAVDPKQVNTIYQQGQGTVTDTLFARGSPWNLPGITLPAYNKKKAQDLFNEVAKEKGAPVEFTITISVSTQSLAETLQAQLAGYQNLKVNVVTIPNVAYLAELAKKSFQAGLLVSAGGFTGDPEPSLTQYYSSTGVRNYGGINDAQLDADIVKGRSTVNTAERKKAYQGAFTKIVDNDRKWFLKLQAKPVPIVFDKKRLSADALPLGAGGFLMERVWVKSGK